MDTGMILMTFIYLNLQEVNDPSSVSNDELYVKEVYIYVLVTYISILRAKCKLNLSISIRLFCY